MHGALLLDDAPKPQWSARATWRPVIYPTPWNGDGTDWGHLPRWSWADPIDDLLAHMEGP